MNVDVLSLDWWNILFTVINLFVFYLLLKKFLFKPIFKVLDKRQEKIDEIHKEADDARNEAVDMKNQYEEVLSNADEKTVKIIERAKENAKIQYEQIVGAAQTESDRLISDAHKSIEIEKKQALKSAKNDIAALAVSIAQKVVGNNTNIENDNDIYDEFLAQVGDSNDTDND